VIHKSGFSCVEAQNVGPAAANNLVKILRMLLNYAVSLDMIDSNPATGVKPYKINSDGFHTWTEDEITQFEATHPVGTKARLAFALLLYTGQRVSDACKMG
jgi:site-specific recombinase XerD